MIDCLEMPAAIHRSHSAQTRNLKIPVNRFHSEPPSKHSKLFHCTQKAWSASGLDPHFTRASVGSMPSPRQQSPSQQLQSPSTSKLDEIADPYVDSEGNNPLHRAFRGIVPTHGDPKDPELLRLINSYADLHPQYLNRRNGKGETPLMILIDQVPIVSLGEACELLIHQKHADPTILNNKDKSVCDYLSLRIASYKDLTKKEDASIQYALDLFKYYGVPPHKLMDSQSPFYNTNHYLHDGISKEMITDPKYISTRRLHGLIL